MIGDNAQNFATQDKCWVVQAELFFVLDKLSRVVEGVGDGSVQFVRRLTTRRKKHVIVLVSANYHVVASFACVYS